MVARSRDGKVTSYPVTETVHKNSICYATQTPAQIPQELQDQAREMAEKTIGCLEGTISQAAWGHQHETWNAITLCSILNKAWQHL